MAKLDGKPFTVIHIEDSDYEKSGTVSPGVKVTTKESFDIDGNKINKFHTTRVAIVKKFTNRQLREDVNNGTPLGPIKCVSEKTQSGDKFWNLVDA